MKRRICNILCGAFVFSVLFVGISGGQSKDIFQKRLNGVKEKYDFADWCPETGKVISGVNISKEVLPLLINMKKVWEKDIYRIGHIQKATYSIIRKWWKLNDDQFDVTMVVCPTLDAAKEYLILRYTDTQMGLPPIKPKGRKFGMDIGNVCFVSMAKQEKSFSSIDFIRHNVLIMMRAQGSLRKELDTIARILDDLLLNKKPVKSCSQLKEIPTITRFSSEKRRIKPGESVCLHLEVKNPKERELRYFWNMSGGGVKKDLKGNFVYYGGEKGKHTVKVTVLNDIGLHHSGMLEIEVGTLREESISVR